MSTVEIAVFPIPNMVTFPTSTVPLHVFEPRYRKMVQDCLDKNMLMGVSHIEKVLKSVEVPQNIEEALNSNQDTFKPQEIFSAGYIQLKSTTEDGRLHIDVQMEGRFKRVELVQEVPYQIFRCEKYNDNNMDSFAKTKILREQLDQFLIKIGKNQNDENLENLISSQVWKDLDDSTYSFRLFQMIQFDPDVAQEILELRSPESRLNFACQLLNLIPFG